MRYINTDNIVYGEKQSKYRANTEERTNKRKERKGKEKKRKGKKRNTDRKKEKAQEKHQVGGEE